MATQAQLSDFFSYLRIPSISAEPARAPEMAACAAWLGGKLGSLGFSVTLHDGYGPPIVVARRSAAAPGAPTLLIYGHYDVQPPGPPELWTTPAFEPAVRDGFVYARGATDNKGQLMAHLLGTEALLSSAGDLPVNLLYVIEGEEEIGSPGFGRFLAAHAQSLACDAILVSDTSMVAPGRPAITCGLRGIACVDLTVRGPSSDLHSGVFGGAVANPATELARLIAALHDTTGRVAVPGFYDQVTPVGPDERAGWRTIPGADQGILDATGAPALAGEEGFTTLERLWSRPTAEVNGITAGYQGPGTKTVLPSEASAKLSFRLVPHQEPGDIARKAAAFFEERAPKSVTIHVHYDHGGDPYHADLCSPLGTAAQEALRAVFGCDATRVREGLSIPVVALLKKVLRRDTVLVGFGLPDCAAHAPNESFPLEQLDHGIAFHGTLLRLYAALSRSI